MLSSKRRNIALHKEIRVKESTAGVRGHISLQQPISILSMQEIKFSNSPMTLIWLCLPSTQARVMRRLNTCKLGGEQQSEDDSCKHIMEIVFTAHRTQAPSPPCKDIERVSSLRVLGVIINDKLAAADHVSTLLTSCSKSVLRPTSSPDSRHTGPVTTRRTSCHCRR